MRISLILLLFCTNAFCCKVVRYPGGVIIVPEGQIKVFAPIAGRVVASEYRESHGICEGRNYLISLASNDGSLAHFGLNCKKLKSGFDDILKEDETSFYYERVSKSGEKIEPTNKEIAFLIEHACPQFAKLRHRKSKK